MIPSTTTHWEIRMTRREIAFLVVGVVAGTIVTGLAQDAATPARLRSGVFAWESIPVEKTRTGERRAIFDSATATTDRLESHITSLDVGQAPHDAHRHPDEELVFVREGIVEATINGVASRAPAG